MKKWTHRECTIILRPESSHCPHSRRMASSASWTNENRRSRSETIGHCAQKRLFILHSSSSRCTSSRYPPHSAFVRSQENRQYDHKVFLFRLFSMINHHWYTVIYILYHISVGDGRERIWSCNEMETYGRDLKNLHLRQRKTTRRARPSPGGGGGTNKLKIAMPWWFFNYAVKVNSRYLTCSLWARIPRVDWRDEKGRESERIKPQPPPPPFPALTLPPTPSFRLWHNKGFILILLCGWSNADKEWESQLPSREIKERRTR